MLMLMERELYVGFNTVSSGKNPPDLSKDYNKTLLDYDISSTCDKVSR